MECARKYSDGTAEVFYYRIDKYGTVIYLDNKSFQEEIEIPANPKVSNRWTSVDLKWKYRIIEVNAVLETPANQFKECIAIEAQATDDNRYKYVNYYSKNIGFVVSKVNGKLEVYLTKWNIAIKKS